MNNNNAEISFDIVGYAAKTEELKAKLLSGMADVFRDTAMGGRKIPDEGRFADMLCLMIMLADRCGADTGLILREMRTRAKTEMAGDGPFSQNCKAVLRFAEQADRR